MISGGDIDCLCVFLTISEKHYKGWYLLRQRSIFEKKQGSRNDRWFVSNHNYLLIVEITVYITNTCFDSFVNKSHLLAMTKPCLLRNRCFWLHVKHHAYLVDYEKQPHMVEDVSCLIPSIFGFVMQLKFICRSHSQWCWCWCYRQETVEGAMERVWFRLMGHMPRREQGGRHSG